MVKNLDRLVGTWKASDPSGAKGVEGQVTFEWMPGGNFLMQHVSLGDMKGIEIIGYDKESKSLKSHFFEGNSGKHLEYTYEVDDDTLKVSIDMPNAKGQFIGKFSEDGNSYSGKWDWTEDGKKMGYEATMTRVILTDDIVTVAPQQHKIIFENNKIRMLWVTVKPGDTVGMHRNPENINYILKSGMLRFTKPNGSVEDVELTEGQVIPAPESSHAVENIGDTEVQTVGIELKN